MIVTRGLGRGTVGALIAGGLGVALSVIIVPTPDYDRYTWLGGVGGAEKGRLVTLKEQHTRASVSLSAVKAKSLLYGIAARGAGKAQLLDLDSGSVLGTLQAAGSAKSLALLVNESSSVGQIFAKGVQDLSDEEIAMLILSVLDL